MRRSQVSMSPIELVLVLRQLPLFAVLEPAELHQVAQITEEHSYSPGEVIGAEGELGEEMHIVLDGVVRVVNAGGETIAIRAAGEVVGEMSLITSEPRVASLIADDDVRALRIGRRQFEAMVHERPAIALAVMRVLAQRLAAMTTDRHLDRV